MTRILGCLRLIKSSRTRLEVDFADLRRLEDARITELQLHPNADGCVTDTPTAMLVSGQTCAAELRPMSVKRPGRP